MVKAFFFCGTGAKKTTFCTKVFLYCKLVPVASSAVLSCCLLDLRKFTLQQPKPKSLSVTSNKTRWLKVFWTLEVQYVQCDNWRANRRRARGFTNALFTSDQTQAMKNKCRAARWMMQERKYLRKIWNDLPSSFLFNAFQTALQMEHLKLNSY